MGSESLAKSGIEPGLFYSRSQGFQKKGEPHFLALRRGNGVFFLLLGGLFSSYLLSWVHYPTYLEEGLPQESFLLFYFLSLVLSLLLLLQKTDFLATLILFCRVYLVAIQNYGAGGGCTVKLIIGIAVLLETALLLSRPYNGIFCALFALLILIFQIPNPVWGSPAGSSIAFLSLPEFGTQFFVYSMVSILTLVLAQRIEVARKIQRQMKLQEMAMKHLAEFNTDLQSYARTVDLRSSERERHRISREIHDISGYIFTNLIALLNAAASIPSEAPDDLAEILLMAQKQAKEGLNETRKALQKTRELPIPEEEGLRAIQKIVAIFQKITGVDVQVNWGNAPHSFGRRVNFVLYRTIQEALTNAIRHGLATHIDIHMFLEEEKLRLLILDNGLGASEVVKGIGLQGMEERVGALGGHIHVEGASGGGFSLEVHIPRCTIQRGDHSFTQKSPPYPHSSV
ncbi:MAG: sensor histidine kinase [Spirochaetales bacterium]|nr:sensor histidine kinase [Spirochaetales bacterium]